MKWFLFFITMTALLTGNFWVAAVTGFLWLIIPYKDDPR